MVQQLILNLDSRAAERLQKIASENGESVEALAQRVLEDAGVDIGADQGDDAELARRIASWRETGASVESGEVHGWLDSLGSKTPLSRPVAKPRA